MQTPASDVTASSASPTSAVDSARMNSPGPLGTPSKGSRPFLHPSVSRLRSGLPTTQLAAGPSSSSLKPLSNGDRLIDRDTATPSLSHFSVDSRASSSTNLHASESQGAKDRKELDAFRWTTLRVVGSYLYSNTPDKASAVLGSPALGSPTVIAANGMICVGTESGRVIVFDFKQNVKCICGDQNSGKHPLLLSVCYALTLSSQIVRSCNCACPI